jgi:hypothetical protein
LKHCIFYILRYVPNLSTPQQFTNLGVFLYCPQARFLDCAFTNDFRDVLRLDPQANLEFLGELQLHFEQEISENELRLVAYINEIGSYSNLIQISDPEVTEADNLEAKLSELFKSYVHPEGGAPRRIDTRMRIKQHLVAAFERHGLIDHKAFMKDVPAAQWTHAGDGFTFDFGYTAVHAARELRLIHALSLVRDNELAETLRSKFQVVVERQPAQLIVGHEDISDGSNATVPSSQGVLRHSHILFVPVTRFEEFARSVEEELVT